MSFIQIGIVLLCVAMISSGQILFKMAAVSINENLSTGFMSILNQHLIAGLFIYVLATALWIYLLRSVALSVAYPFMALSFLIVPVVSYYFFNEPLSLKVIIGGALVIVGVCIIAR